MSEEGVINIEDENLNDIISDPSKYKSWFVQILKSDNSKLSKKVIKKINKNEIDDELDMLLRRLSRIMPYNILIPCLRDQLCLSIQTDEDCTQTLNSIKSYLTEDGDKNMIDQIITFINSNEGELSDGIVPEVDLMAIVDRIPIEKLPAIYNCIDYIALVTE
jgi:hypothetical protein